MLALDGMAGPEPGLAGIMPVTPSLSTYLPSLSLRGSIYRSTTTISVSDVHQLPGLEGEPVTILDVLSSE